jgi:hypothetical protein
MGDTEGPWNFGSHFSIDTDGCPRAFDRLIAMEASNLTKNSLVNVDACSGLICYKRTDIGFVLTWRSKKNYILTT